MTVSVGVTVEQQRAYFAAETRVFNERLRQYQLLAAGKFVYGPESSSLSPSEILAVLSEEHGEVSRHVRDAISNPAGLDKRALREEVVQVAAVAIGWVERLNREIREEAEAELTASMSAPAAPATPRPAPAVLMYHDLYDAEERADWQRDPEVGA